MVLHRERPQSEGSAPSESVTSRAYTVSGRVQGVGFRQWTRRTAEGLGLSGTVRNLSNGSVEVVAWGAASALTHLEAALQRGPLPARVERVERLDIASDPPSGGFRVIS